MASGTTCNKRSICSATGVISLVPVTLVPGASLLSTSPASGKLVIAVPTMGISSVADAITCAAGVAMARITSASSEINCWAMFCRLLWSFWAFCWLMVKFLPSSKPLSFKPSIIPWLARSNAPCCTSCTTPTLYCCPSAPPPQPASIPIDIAAMAATAAPFIHFLCFMFTTILPSFVFTCLICHKRSRQFMPRSKKDTQTVSNLLFFHTTSSIVTVLLSDFNINLYKFP